MILRILAVGDVVGAPGLTFLTERLRAFQEQEHIDFTVVNGENANVVGVTPKQADAIFAAGADVITMGNHTWGRRELVPYLERSREVLRPANLPQQQPGRGWGVFETPFGDVAVIDLIGRCGMDYTPDNPFQLVERILRKTRVVLTDGEELVTAAPAALLEAVPDGVFLRCHQSYWANFSHITAMEKDEFVLTGGLRVPISRSYRSAARSAFFANLRGEEG